MWLDRRRRFAGGQVFGLYLMAYTLGRAWIEMLRIDDAHTFGGLRLNVWTSLLVFAVGAVLFVIAGRLGRSSRVEAPAGERNEQDENGEENCVNEEAQASSDGARQEQDSE